jgi:hypothetical protein
MTTLKKLLATLLFNLGQRLIALANKLDTPEFNIFETSGSFATFKEGMASTDYRTRHVAATKLLGWYLSGDGQPVIGDLTSAARIFLEQFVVTDGDVSTLVDYWIAQASATTDDDRNRAELGEQMFYDQLQPKDHSITTK